MADAADDRAPRTRDRARAQTAEAGHLGRLRREREIAQVLARHGLVFRGHVLGLDRLDSALRHEPSSEATVPAQELRRALEELGPTSIKLRQLLSTRADLLSDDYRRELEKLRSFVVRPLHRYLTAALRERVSGARKEASVGVDNSGRRRRLESKPPFASNP